jgi:hypothetical protein
MSEEVTRAKADKNKKAVRIEPTISSFDISFSTAGEPFIGAIGDIDVSTPGEPNFGPAAESAPSILSEPKVS